MSHRRTIPRTPIMLRYQALRAMPQALRLAEARRLVAQPQELAAEFAGSVALFAPYDNARVPFYPPERVRRTYADEIKRTNDLVLRLERQRRITPIDAPGRRNEHAAGPTVEAVAADALAFDYVDRELLVQRTTSPAQWDDGEPNLGGIRLDALLAEAVDRTPIVAEVKLGRDMDPFFALIQALACAAHLATANQYERMRRHLARGAFPPLSGAPRLDVAVLFADDATTASGRPAGRYMADLTRAAEALAPKLLAHDEIANSIRRIAGIGMSLDDDGLVRADVRWAWARSARGDARTRPARAARTPTTEPRPNAATRADHESGVPSGAALKNRADTLFDHLPDAANG